MPAVEQNGTQRERAHPRWIASAGSQVDKPSGRALELGVLVPGDVLENDVQPVGFACRRHACDVEGEDAASADALQAAAWNANTDGRRAVMNAD
jgi:hypothetical protein